MELIRHTISWVVEVPAKDDRLSPWRAEDVQAACDLSDGGSWEWTILDPDNLSSADAMSLRVWKEYRDGKRTKSR